MAFRSILKVLLLLPCIIIRQLKMLRALKGFARRWSAKNEVWVQIISDCTGKSLGLLEVVIRRGAINAALMLGIYSSYKSSR